MAKTKKTEAAVPETAPELEIPQDPYQELMEPDPVEEPETVEAAVPETAPELEIPQDPYQELMEPDPIEEPETVETAPEEPEPVETAPIEYAVTGCDYLNLREAPSLDAPVIVRLPRGVGVSDTGEIQGEWCEVATGRLTGWVMAQYLEPVWS